MIKIVVGSTGSLDGGGVARMWRVNTIEVSALARFDPPVNVVVQPVACSIRPLACSSVGQQRSPVPGEYIDL